VFLALGLEGALGESGGLAVCVFGYKYPTTPNHLENTPFPSTPLTPTVTLNGDVKKRGTLTRFPTKKMREVNS
jgi:hypothetical protein